MNKLFRKLASTVLFITVFTVTYSQVKYEKENRMKRAAIPPSALKLIDSLAIQGKIKWYYEESLTGSSVEAKFRFNKKKHSLEFDTKGVLQDVEITVQIDEIRENVRETIFRNLESEFDRYTIKKIQAQYPGKNPEILTIIKNPPKETGNSVKFELIVNGKTGKTTKQYEMIFNSSGILTEKKEIIQKNADNLAF